MSVDFSFVVPVVASGVAVAASLLKNAAVKRNVQSSKVVFTRPDGSKIKLEAEKTSEGELKPIIEQISKLFLATNDKK